MSDDPAYRLAATRMFLSAEDVTAIEDLVRKAGDVPRVIDLGAGSGTTALAVYCANQRALVTTIDREREPLAWVEKNVRPYFPDVIWTPWWGDAAAGAEQFSDEAIDLLLHDAGHEYNDVHQDLLAWWPKLRPGAYVWVHDYQGAPWGGDTYPGVKQAVEALVLAGHYEEIGPVGMGWIGRKPGGA